MLTDTKTRLAAGVRWLPHQWSSLGRQRLLLLIGSGVLFAAPLLLFQPAAYWAGDPELFRLLRGMGVLKIAIAVLALAVLWWRLGRPVRPRLQAVFLGGVWLLSLGAGLIWQLTLILPASGLFHCATLALLVAAWRDVEPRLAHRQTTVRDPLPARASAPSAVSGPVAGSR